MADAESNLVPSEAADQVEVALEEQAAADDGILYLNEYQYENDLVTDFARLVASPRRRGSLYVAAAIAALIGIGMLVAGGNWIKFGVVLIVFGAFLAWWSKNLHHTLARDFIDAVEADESMGGRYRRVAANEDGLMVWGKSGKSQFFPFEKLDHVLDGERIFVAMFADQGVTIPKDTFVRGDAEQFGSFLKARINKKLRIETKRKKMKAEKAAAKAKAQECLDKINSGELSFEDTVEQYSDDTGSKEKKGDVGWDKLTTFVDSYQTALEGLNKGDVSDVVESTYGYHVIKCTDYFHVDNQVDDINQVPKAIKKYVSNVVKTQAASTAYSEWLEQYKKDADITVNPMPKDVPYNVSLKGVTKSSTDDSSTTE